MIRSTMHRVWRLARNRRRTTSAPASGADYRSIFEHCMEAALLTAPDGRVLLANRAAAELFGYTEIELKRLGRQAVVDDCDPRLAAALEERRRTGRFRGELTMKRKDGSRLEVELSSAVFRDAQGREFTSMFMRDISARKAREAQLRNLMDAVEAERRWLQAVLAHVPVGVILRRPDGRVSLNAKAEVLLGTSPSQPDGGERYGERMLFPDGRAVPADELPSSRALRTGETLTGAEFFIARPDGSRIPVVASAGPIRDVEDRIIGGIGVCQDVSESMRAAEAVRASERLLDGVFQLLPVGVWIADRTGRIVRANAAGERIWAGARYVGPAQFGEYRAWWADTGEPIEPEDWALSRALRRGETSVGELIRIECFDGTQKTIINSALPLYDERGEFAGAIAVNEDVTHLRDAEAALRRAVAQRDHVLGVVAHDLRSPLNTIHLHLKYLQQAAAAATQADDAVDGLLKQVERMDRLIEDLLDVTRIETGTLTLACERLAPGDVVSEVCEAHWRPAAVAALTLGRDLQQPLPDVLADRGRVVQVLNNLVGNAMKFTPRGGHITIGAARRAAEVLFWVEDTGIGMEASVCEHVFDRFWQAGPDRRGVGLGLGISKAIVQQHGGTMWVNSTPGHGSCFYFTLPVAPAAPPQSSGPE